MDKVEFWQSLRSWLQQGPQRRQGEGLATAKLEEKIIQDVGKVLEELALWIVHWKLRDHAKASLMNDLQHPVKTFLYFWSDWKEPLFERKSLNLKNLHLKYIV